MKLENQVCSLELAKKLKELGVKQDAYYSWVIKKLHHIRDVNLDDTDTAKITIELDDSGNKHRPDLYSAFTAAELGEMLPENRITLEKKDNKWWNIFYA